VSESISKSLEVITSIFSFKFVYIPGIRANNNNILTEHNAQS